MDLAGGGEYTGPPPDGEADERDLKEEKVKREIDEGAFGSQNLQIMLKFRI